MAQLRRLVCVTATLLLIQGGLTGCGGSSVTPKPHAASAATRHAKDCAISDSECTYPVPPAPDSAPYINPSGNACDPTTPQFDANGNLIPCLPNPNGPSQQQPVSPGGYDPTEYTPQCYSVYGANSSLWHNCYTNMNWRP